MLLLHERLDLSLELGTGHFGILLLFKGKHRHIVEILNRLPSTPQLFRELNPLIEA